LGKLVGFGNKLRVMLDWTLDLFIERSTSQLHAARNNLASRAVEAPESEPRGKAEANPLLRGHGAAADHNLQAGVLR
jgi:hypothetical protein